jgi:hypothetical protein
MITNDAELEVVRQQLGRVEAILSSLREEVLPKSERMFNLFAESWIDMRQELQADVAAYLGTATVPAEAAGGKTAPTETKTLRPVRDDRAGGNQVT